MRKLCGSRQLAVLLLLLLPVLHASALLPCPGQTVARDDIIIDVGSVKGCVLQPWDALPGTTEPDSRLLLRGTPFSASQGASSAIIQQKTAPAFEELAGSLVEAVVRDVQLLVPASVWLQPGASLQQLLLQPLFGQAVPRGLRMTNVIFLFETADMQQAAAVLDAAVSDSSIQQRVADWTLDVFTDNSSFAVVSGELGGAQMAGVGIFLKPAAATAAPTPAKTAAAAAVGGVNYLLGVTNSSFVAVLETYMSLDTPVPFYMLLATNISWGQLLPEGGEMMSINRPLFMAGQAGSLTGVDFGSRVNQVALTGQWSNVTFDELVLENMGLGNSLSAQSGTPGLSLVASINMWFFFWDRNSPRISTNNCTLVVASQREVEFLQYWGFAFSAQDKDIKGQAGWLASGVGTTVWEADVIGNNTLAHKVVNRVVINSDSLVTSEHLVFPNIPATNALDPSVFGAALEVQAGSPLVSMCNTNMSLQLAMNTLDRVVRGSLLIIAAPQLSVQHEGVTNVVTERNKAFFILNNITYLGSDLCRSAADRCMAGPFTDKRCSTYLNSSTGDLQLQADLLSKVIGSNQTMLPGGSPCDDMTSAMADAVELRILKLGHAPILDFQLVVDYIHLESEGLDSERSCASFRDLTLRGLPQGRGVPGAARGRNTSLHWHPTHGFGRRLLAPHTTAAAAAAGAASGGFGRRLLGPHTAAAAAGAAGAAASGGLGRRLQRQARQLLAPRGTLTHATPDVWTILMWSVTRDRSNYVNMTGVQLLLPQPEYDVLLAAVAPQQGKPVDVHIELDDGTEMHLTAAHTLGSCCIHVGRFEGPGIVGSDILLLPNPDQRAAMPQSYLFPAQGSILQVGPSGSQQGSGNLSPGAAAGIVLSAVAACVLLLVAGLFVAWNIRARRHARAGASLHNAAKHSNGYNSLSKGAADSEHSDHGSSGATDQNAAAAAGVAGGSVGSGGSSAQARSCRC